MISWVESTPKLVHPRFFPPCSQSAGSNLETRLTTSRTFPTLFKYWYSSACSKLLTYHFRWAREFMSWLAWQTIIEIILGRTCLSFIISSLFMLYSRISVLLQPEEATKARVNLGEKLLCLLVLLYRPLRCDYTQVTELDLAWKALSANASHVEQLKYRYLFISL